MKHVFFYFTQSFSTLVHLTWGTRLIFCNLIGTLSALFAIGICLTSSSFACPPISSGQYICTGSNGFWVLHISRLQTKKNPSGRKYKIHEDISIPAVMGTQYFPPLIKTAQPEIDTTCVGDTTLNIKPVETSVSVGPFYYEYIYDKDNKSIIRIIRKYSFEVPFNSKPYYVVDRHPVTIDKCVFEEPLRPVDTELNHIEAQGISSFYNAIGYACNSPSTDPSVILDDAIHMILQGDQPRGRKMDTHQKLQFLKELCNSQSITELAVLTDILSCINSFRMGAQTQQTK